MSSVPTRDWVRLAYECWRVSSGGMGLTTSNVEDFGHLMRRADSFEKTLMLGKITGERRRGRQRMRWLDCITDAVDMSLSNSRTWWWTGRPGMLQAIGWQRVWHDWVTELTDWQCWGRWIWMVLWRPTKPSRTNTPKRCPFHYRGLECKGRKSKTPGVTGKFGLRVQNEAGQTLIEFCQDNALVITSTHFQQHKRRLYTWTSPDGQHQNHIDYILCSQRWRSSIQSAKTRLRADCGSDHELLIAKFRLKLKKVGKTTRPFNMT